MAVGRKLGKLVGYKTRNTKNIFTRFSSNESGATAIEYGLLAAILAVGIIVGAQGIGSVVTNMWTNVATDVGTT